MRSDLIRERLDRLALDELLIGVATPDRDEWARLEWVKARFGVLPPVMRDGTIIVAYQPDVIDEWTADLSPEAFDTIMETLEWMICIHVALMLDHPDMDEDTRVRQVESELYDSVASEALSFLSMVQADAS